MHLVLFDYVLILGWVLALAVVLAGGTAILAWLLNFFSGEINVWKEIRRKNLAMAIVFGSIVLTLGLIVALINK
ncbi:MAG: DUF350 domain-containing protein [Patescibacteria group bacterium]